MIKKLVLLVGSTICAFFLAEVTLRLVGFEPMHVNPEQLSFWEYDARLGWAHRPGQEGVFEKPQFRTAVRINSRGLRDREHAYDRPALETKRILVLGDSFAWGFGVDESERFSELLETSLNVEVINAGVSGYGTDQELLWYRDEGSKYDVDLVVLMFSGNDEVYNHQLRAYSVYYKPLFVLGDGELTLTGVPTPRAGLHLTLGRGLRRRSALFQRLGAVVSPAYRKTEYGSQPRKTTDKPFELTTALIDALEDEVRSNGANLLIVANSRWWHSPFGGNYDEFLETLRSEGHFVLDVESMDGFDEEDMIIPEDGHWNRSGHVFVADQIALAIADRALLPATPPE